MDSPPHSPQTSPLQVSPLAMRPPNPDSPPQQTPPPPSTTTYKRKIRSKSTRPMASAPPLAKRTEPPTTPLSEPPPKNPKTSTSTRHEAGVSTSTPQAKSPSSSKKQMSAASQVSKLPWPLPDAAHKAAFKRLKERRVQPTRYISVDALQSVGLFDNVVAYLDGYHVQG
ncbi:proline-rich receptor-like protein kinase PERK2 [Hevea brasiliensis]|uniref:proline-rich receptor-like protein kinase PERK2 n=1 Tax=Hevea brasiliensis TaxID=3981 RepID=UPI0025DE00A6|nr:proline-rich receptor-like protein kinase PERK2 [Hevea brasiliensis]